MSSIDPRLLSLSNSDHTMPESATAALAQTPQRAQRRRRTKSIVVRAPIVLRPIEPRPQRGPHSGNRSGAAGLQVTPPMIKPRKPRAERIKTTRKSGERKAKDTPPETDSDGDSGSVVASDHGIRWKDGIMQWWNDKDRRWSMMPHYVVTLGCRY